MWQHPLKPFSLCLPYPPLGTHLASFPTFYPDSKLLLSEHNTHTCRGGVTNPTEQQPIMQFLHLFGQMYSATKNKNTHFQINFRPDSSWEVQNKSQLKLNTQTEIKEAKRHKHSWFICFILFFSVSFWLLSQLPTRKWLADYSRSPAENKKQTHSRNW